MLAAGAGAAFDAKSDDVIGHGNSL